MDSHQQELILAIVPKITASFGIPCEVFLMYLVYGDHVKKRANPMLRALFGISFFGLCDAIGWFLSSWAVPEGTFALSAGNQATCNFQGFLLQFVIGAPFYSCALAYYFYDVIVNERSFDELLRKERYIHAGIISYAFFTSILLLSLGQYNPIGNICWTVGLPSGCGNSVYVADPAAPDCERGDWAWVLCMIFFYIPLWCCIMLILYFNFAIWMKLRNTEDGRWFATQSTLYSLAFLVTWLPSTLWSIAMYSNAGGFGLEFASALFEPTAGVWNLSIFLRNRQSIKRKMWNLLCCNFDLLNDCNGELDDIEGAPRKRDIQKKKQSNAGTAEELRPSTRREKHKKSGKDNSKSSGTSLTESEYARRKENKRRKKEKKRREAEDALADEALTKNLDNEENGMKKDKKFGDKSVLDRVLAKRQDMIHQVCQNRVDTFSTSTVPVAVVNIIENEMVGTDLETNDDIHEPSKEDEESIDAFCSNETKVAPDARLEI